MSVPEVPQRERPPVPPRRLGGCASIFIALLGVILLLPGLCSLVFIVWANGAAGGGRGALWIVTFVIAACGFLLIRYAVRGR
jgi:hypothetical protein